MTRKPGMSARPKKILKSDPEIAYARRDERALASSARKCLSYVRDTGTLLAWRVAHGTTGIPSASLELHVMGTGSAIAEAILLVVAHAIIEETGLKERSLSINNIGSYESSNRFVRDVGLYLRKHIESISPTLRPKAVEDPLGTLVQLIERGHPATPRAPQPMEYLTEEERQRFWELLEYLEVFGLQYELNAHILGSRDCWAHSLFEISVVDEESSAHITIASGGRYDPLATRFAGRPISAAMISITSEVRGSSRVKRETHGAPTIYFAHLGPEARRRSLGVMEILRHAEIPVYQGLCYDRMGEQMTQARELATPHILIMGYKEAMEGTVVVREVMTNSQDAVPLPDLTAYLKRHHIGAWQIPEKV
ncbi:MAG: Histidine-tRNA ligase [Candidatus Kaiserbacteria bacterium GW2011_GWB1_52_6]|nr:MAG: Histidine-tRNA ligase [Candidatus Kaiserbacteria bacterium GW2011_GWB1_52_6]